MGRSAVYDNYLNALSSEAAYDVGNFYGTDSSNPYSSINANRYNYMKKKICRATSSTQI